MHVRYFEGWACHVLSAQPWVKSVRTFAAAGIAKPAGIAVEPTAGQPVLVQFVRASPSVPAPDEQPEEWTEANALPVEPVQASTGSPKEWAAALASALRAAAHPEVRTVETYDEWGKSPKPAGIRVAFTDGSEIFGTVLDRGR